MQLHDALAKARAQSAEHGCTQHVCAGIAPTTRTVYANGETAIVGAFGIDSHGYTVSDWYDASTVASYTNGREH